MKGVIKVSQKLDYLEIFKQLQIQPKPLPQNYDPDDYGRSLLRDCLPDYEEADYSTNTEQISPEDVVVVK